MIIQNGFFVEAGAADCEFSVSLPLEANYGWTGILVEAVPGFFKHCKKVHRLKDRQKERQLERKIDRKKDRQIERKKDRQKERQIDRQIERQIMHNFSKITINAKLLLNMSCA